MRVIRNKGSRQRIWDVLRSNSGLDASRIAVRAKANPDTTAVYLGGLRKFGYAESLDGEWALVTDTGPIAPSYTTKPARLVDLNLEPPMSGEELERIWRSTGLSLGAFSQRIGKGLGQSKR